jgi:hypothetical protein
VPNKSPPAEAVNAEPSKIFLSIFSIPFWWKTGPIAALKNAGLEDISHGISKYCPLGTIFLLSGLNPQGLSAVDRQATYRQLTTSKAFTEATARPNRCYFAYY